MWNHARSRLLFIGGLSIVLARPLQAQTAQEDAAPDAGQRPPRVAPLFEQPGVLTPRGTYVVEPAVQFAHSSSDRIAFAGYAMILTLFDPRIDVREVRRNSTVASLTARRGITNRFELEVRVPYVYRSDDIVSRDMVAGAVTDRVVQDSGKAIGDVELAARYQLNQGSLHRPYFVGGVRFKSRTGRDPFEAVTDCLVRCTEQNAAGTGLPSNLATGSGFYALEPNIAWFMPANPATFFGTVSYMHNFKRSNVNRKVLNGGSEPLGTITPPDSFGFNAGIGFALNDKVGLSVGYDHISVGRAKQNGQTLPNSLRLQLGTIMAGFSYRLDQRRTINVSIGGGLTRDAPDVGLMVRVPLAF
ncbi:acetate kinase [Massilia forsythiae]|uniref:acetate kinase n=1 Tax=Massilia forsythiae TaxID=2728020 RepID=UPI001E28DC92|nr:acetate kinase [Massilia forsythiae]